MNGPGGPFFLLRMVRGDHFLCDRPSLQVAASQALGAGGACSGGGGEGGEGGGGEGGGENRPSLGSKDLT